MKNIRPNSAKLLEENIGRKFLDIGLGNDFLIMTTKADNESENQPVGLHQTKKLLHSKRNNKQNEKASQRVGENICKQYLW